MKQHFIRSLIMVCALGGLLAFQGCTSSGGSTAYDAGETLTDAVENIGGGGSEAPPEAAEKPRVLGAKTACPIESWELTGKPGVGGVPNDEIRFSFMVSTNGLSSLTFQIHSTDASKWGIGSAGAPSLEVSFDGDCAPEISVDLPSEQNCNYYNFDLNFEGWCGGEPGNMTEIGGLLVVVLEDGGGDDHVLNEGNYANFAYKLSTNGDGGCSQNIDFGHPLSSGYSCN